MKEGRTRRDRDHWAKDTGRDRLYDGNERRGWDAEILSEKVADIPSSREQRVTSTFTLIMKKSLIPFFSDEAVLPKSSVYDPGIALNMAESLLHHPCTPRVSYTEHGGT